MEAVLVLILMLASSCGAKPTPSEDVDDMTYDPGIDVSDPNYITGLLFEDFDYYDNSDEFDFDNGFYDFDDAYYYDYFYELDFDVYDVHNFTTLLANYTLEDLSDYFGISGDELLELVYFDTDNGNYFKDLMMHFTFAEIGDRFNYALDEVFEMFDSFCIGSPIYNEDTEYLFNNFG